MKRSFGTSALLLAALVARPAAAAEPDWPAVSRDAAALLAGAIRIDTTNPPGRELAAARHFARYLEAHGIDAELVEGASERGSVIARLPATKPDGSGPVLLLSHLDVVPADPTEWKTPPFAGAIQGGAVWGRGALDDKGHGAVFATALVELAESGAPRRRDLVFCASADEEMTGAAGIEPLIARHWAALGPPAMVWNEGGASAPLDELGGIVANGIATTEKRALWLTLVAEGEGGHGSQPVKDAANDRLVRALARVSAWETPLRLTPTVAEQFSRLAARTSFPWNVALFGLQLPGGLALGGRFLTQDRVTNAMVRDTVALTGLHSGLKHNVIPGHAEATLDVRLLPDTDAAAFLRDLAAVIDDPLRARGAAGGRAPPAGPRLAVGERALRGARGRDGARASRQRDAARADHRQHRLRALPPARRAGLRLSAGAAVVGAEPHDPRPRRALPARRARTRGARDDARARAARANGRRALGVSSKSAPKRLSDFDEPGARGREGLLLRCSTARRAERVEAGGTVRGSTGDRSLAPSLECGARRAAPPGPRQAAGGPESSAERPLGTPLTAGSASRSTAETSVRHRTHDGVRLRTAGRLPRAARRL